MYLARSFLSDWDPAHDAVTRQPTLPIETHGRTGKPDHIPEDLVVSKQKT